MDLPLVLEKELHHPGRLLWLSIAGVPLHAWNQTSFLEIAKNFSQVMEVEDWTTSHVHTHIGCVLVY